jgi:uncharacterized protein (TIGR03067 family)
MQPASSPLLLIVLFVLAPPSLHAQAPTNSTFSLSPGDVTEATIAGSDRTRLQVTLTPEKSAALSALTGLNLNKQVKIVVCGKVRSEPFIRERMAGPSMEIFVSSPEDAIATVKALLTSELTFDQLHKWTDSSGQTHYSDKPPVRSPDQRRPTGQVAGDRNKNAFKELQGSWAVVKATMNSKESHDPSILEVNWRFKDNELILESPQKGTVRFALEMDEQAEPKALYLTPIEPAKERSGWMLFSRDRDTLKIAFHDNLDGRPEGFSEPDLVVATLAPKK